MDMHAWTQNYMTISLSIYQAAGAPYTKNFSEIDFTVERCSHGLL